MNLQTDQPKTKFKQGVWAGYLLAFVCALILLLPQSGLAGNKPAGGDNGDSFPFFCVNFSGEWRTDDGAAYEIGQQRCELVTINRQHGIDSQFIEIVPDNKVREVEGETWHGTSRYRWNSLEYGTVIEMIATRIYDDKTVTEVKQFEHVSYYLILESTYRVVENHITGETRRESEQQLLRRCGAAAEAQH